MKPTDHRSVESYLQAWHDETLRKREALYEDAFKRGWRKILSLEVLFEAEKYEYIKAELPYCVTLDQAEDAGTNAAIQYSNDLHGPEAA